MSGHVPVLLNEVVRALQPAPGKVFIDGTFGAGGYSRALLARGAKVIAFDRDASVVSFAEELAKEYGAGFRFFNARFSEIPEVLSISCPHQVAVQVDGLVADIGVSSMQIDEARRGFSYMKDGPLLMNMGGGGLDAARVVNKYKEPELAEVLRRYGELKNSRTLAKKIAAARPVASTLALADIVGKEYASRVFQAIRIEVNDELGELSRLLAGADKLIKPGGVLAVVTFHSLEDRIVKKFFSREAVSRYSPSVAAIKSFQSAMKSAIIPSEAEVAANPRAASAKLRFGVRA